MAEVLDLLLLLKRILQMNNMTCLTISVPFDINTCVMLTFCEMGKRLSILEKFCGIMNMQPPINKNCYNGALHILLDVYQNLVDKSMKNVVEETYQFFLIVFLSKSCFIDWIFSEPIMEMISNLAQLFITLLYTLST